MTYSGDVEDAPAWGLVALALALVLGLMAVFSSGCSVTSDQGLSVAREERVLLRASPVSTDPQFVSALAKAQADEDALEVANGTTGYLPWFASFAAVAPVVSGK